MDEEMRKTMQFILEQQAQYAAGQQQTGERVALLEANMAKLAASQQELAASQQELAASQQGLAASQQELAASQQETNKRVARLETSMTEMAREMSNMSRTQTHMNEVVAAMLDSHKHTEEKLDAFIGVLERYISEDRNGRAGGGGVS